MYLLNRFQVTSEFQQIREQIQDMTDAIGDIEQSESGTLIKKPTPTHRYSAPQERIFSARGPNAKAIVKAHIKVAGTKRQLEHKLKELKNIHSLQRIESDKVKNAIIQLADIAQQNQTLEGVLGVSFIYLHVG